MLITVMIQPKDFNMQIYVNTQKRWNSSEILKKMNQQSNYWVYNMFFLIKTLSRRFLQRNHQKTNKFIENFDTSKQTENRKSYVIDRQNSK